MVTDWLFAGYVLLAFFSLLAPLTIDDRPVGIAGRLAFAPFGPFLFVILLAGLALMLAALIFMLPFVLMTKLFRLTNSQEGDEVR